MRYEVVNLRTGERFGNHHTYAHAASRAEAMRRNWLYRERFEVREIAEQKKPPKTK